MCNAEINESKSQLEPVQEAVVLGVHVNLVSKTFRLDPKFSAKASLLAKHALKCRKLTITALFGLLGTMNWAFQVLRIPWCFYRPLLEVLRKASRLLHYGNASLEDYVELPAEALDCVERFVSVTEMTILWSPPPAPPEVIHYSDASDVGYGAVVLEGDVCRALLSVPWSNKKLPPISVREAYAARSTILKFAKKSRPFHLVMDNAGVYFGLLKGSTSNYPVEQYIRQIVLFTALLDITLFVSLVGTDDMRADAPSRLEEGVSEPTRVLRPAPVLVPWGTGGVSVFSSTQVRAAIADVERAPLPKDIGLIPAEEVVAAWLEGVELR
jgi:hypothetical protein